MHNVEEYKLCMHTHTLVFSGAASVGGARLSISDWRAAISQGPASLNTPAYWGRAGLIERAKLARRGGFSGRRVLLCTGKRSVSRLLTMVLSLLRSARESTLSNGFNARGDARSGETPFSDDLALEDAVVASFNMTSKSFTRCSSSLARSRCLSADALLSLISTSFFTTRDSVEANAALSWDNSVWSNCISLFLSLFSDFKFSSSLSLSSICLTRPSIIVFLSVVSNSLETLSRRCIARGERGSGASPPPHRASPINGSSVLNADILDGEFDVPASACIQENSSKMT